MRHLINWLFGWKHIYIPECITLIESEYWLDGGSTTLFAVSESGSRHLIHLTQRTIPGSANPGRLMFDQKLIAVRSDEESRIVELLRAATIDAADVPPPPQPENRLILGDDIKDVMTSSPTANIEKFRSEFIDYLESDEYLEIAKNGLPRNAG